MRGAIACATILILLTAREGLHINTPWPLGAAYIAWIVVMTWVDARELNYKRRIADALDASPARDAEITTASLKGSFLHETK